jgi:hypothetical protein
MKSVYFAVDADWVQAIKRYRLNMAPAEYYFTRQERNNPLGRIIVASLGFKILKKLALQVKELRVASVN